MHSPFLRFLRLFPLLLILTHCVVEVPEEAEETFDLVVYGGTSAGVAAAIQASRMDASVVLIEPGIHLGGLTTGGLGFTDSGDKSVIGGISREVYHRVKKHYDQADAWLYEDASGYDRYRADEDAMWTFEPRVAESILETMIAEEDITVIR
ncbi:MAG TPA: FAD-dependent oxidoreductase, partial [Acidobacteriota bacterium]|nr:FAD-dependent oxidoreductase [Acidobacteriota bacterium]